MRKTQQKSIEWAKEVGITEMVAATLGDGNGGLNPTLEGRFSSMHLQDVNMKGPAPAPTAASGRQRGGRYPQVPLGQGRIDWAKTFSAAKVGGVKSYFVEQNWELTQASVAYLKMVNV